MRRFLLFGKPKPVPDEEAPRTFTDAGPVSGSVVISKRPADKMVRRPSDKER